MAALEVDARLYAYYFWTTLCAAMQAFIFQPWSRLLVATVVWSLLVSACLVMSIQTPEKAHAGWLSTAMAVSFVGYASYWILGQVSMQAVVLHFNFLRLQGPKPKLRPIFSSFGYALLHKWGPCCCCPHYGEAGSRAPAACMCCPWTAEDTPHAFHLGKRSLVYTGGLGPGLLASFSWDKSQKRRLCEPRAFRQRFMGIYEPMVI